MKSKKTLEWLEHERINYSDVKNELMEAVCRKIFIAVKSLQEENQEPEPLKFSERLILEWFRRGVNFTFINGNLQSDLSGRLDKPEPEKEYGYCPVCNSKTELEKPLDKPQEKIEVGDCVAHWSYGYGIVEKVNLNLITTYYFALKRTEETTEDVVKLIRKRPRKE